MPNNQLLSLLVSFIHNTEPVCAEPRAAEALWQCARRQNLLPILAYQNKKWKLFKSEELQDRLSRVLYAQIMASATRCADFETLSGKMSEAGIAHMPVKGFYLRELYPVPELRTFGDIDVLIHSGDRDKLDKLLREQGYHCKQNWEPSYSYVKGQEYYEMHINLMDGNLDGRSDLQAFFGEAWSYAMPDEALRSRPGESFHFCYLLCHLAKHLYGGGAGLRMYLDLALFLKAKGDCLDWPWLVSTMEQLGLLHFMRIVLRAAASWFQLEKACPADLLSADDAAVEQLLEFTLGADLFGHLRDHAAIHMRNRARETGTAARPWQLERSNARSCDFLAESTAASPTGMNARLRYLRSLLFPAAATIENRYTFLKGRHWLLPAAWLARAFINLRLLPERLRAVRRATQVRTEEMVAHDTFMRSIGL